MSLCDFGSCHINPGSGADEVFISLCLWSQLSIIDVISFCACTICFSSVILSVVASRMNVCSGIMVTSWLSSLPWLASGGCDNKSAVTCLLLGTCFISKL